MGYPGSFIEWIDNSAIPQRLPIAETDNSPLFGAMFASEMGPEEWTTIVGDEFFDLFGSKISFIKYGQPLLQAAMMINSGAKLYCKRVVADDAAYANIGVIAKITDAVVGGEQVKNEAGQPLYWKKDPTTGENTNEQVTAERSTVGGRFQDNDPVLTEPASASLRFEPFSVENATTVDQIYKAFEAEYDADAKVFPLFIFVENGRGVSNKSWSISPSYEMSKNSKYMVYVLTIDVDGNKTTVQFTFNPDYILDGKSFCLQQRVLDSSKQLKCKQFDSYINEFMETLATAMTTDDNVVTVADIKNQDILFGYTRKGLPMVDESVFSYNTEGMALNSAYGNKLINGSNGSFGSNPIKADTYSDALLKALDQDLYPEVWDNENNKIIAIFDADYPVPVKQELERLADWRQDFLYFRDFGSEGLKTFSEINEVFTGTDETPGVDRSMFIKPYPIYGEITDPYTQKDIIVTLPYLLSLKFITHCINGVNNPFAGIKFNITFPEIHRGTLNFIPSVTPKYDYKTMMNDNRLNYCAYHNELLVMETDYTALEEYTQWSYGCNVAATQAVVRAIRTICPENRYTLTTKSGLMAYEDDINNKVIRNFTDWFEILRFEYIGDEISLANKQYWGAISVKFTDFIQEEHFTVTALPSITVSD